MKLKYNWHDNFDIFLFLLAIYSNTCTVMEKRPDINCFANEIVNDIEDYFMYFKNNGYDLKMILERLKDILYVKVAYSIPLVRKGMVYLDQPPVINGDRCIIINENLNNDDYLDVKGYRRLHLYKGLSRLLFNFNVNKINTFSETYDDNTNDSLLVNTGWMMIRDTLAEELAERITFDALNRKRPGNLVGNRENDYYPLVGSFISSTLLFDRAFDKPVTSFGQTLSGIGNIMDYSRDKIMDDFINKGIKHDLSDLIISEYIYKGNGHKLYDILYLMGLLMNEKMALYGYRLNTNIKLSNHDVINTYKDILEECHKLFTFDDDVYEDVPIVNNIIKVKG